MVRRVVKAAVMAATMWCVAAAMPAGAAEPAPVKSGEITIPWSEFKALLDRLEQLSAVKPEKVEPPTDYLLSAGYYRGEVRGQSVVFEANVEFEVLSGEFVTIPIFPASLPVEKALLDGQPVTLTPEGDWVQLVLKGAKKHKLTFTFSIPINGKEDETIGFRTARTALTLVDVKLPRPNLDVHVVPLSGLTTTPEKNATRIKAVLPVTDHVYISWASALKKPYNIAYADYKATVEGESVVMEATYKVSVFSEKRVAIPLVGTDVALESITIGGKAASPSIENSRFVVYADEPGEREITIRFIAAVLRNSGPPGVTFQVPEVPVSLLSFAVAGGDHKIEVTPARRIQVDYEKEKTTLKAVLPVTKTLKISWIAGGRPEEVETAFAYAQTASLCEYSEGAFRVTHHVEYDIRRGKLNALSFLLPKDWEVFDVKGTDIHSWSETNEKQERRLNVLLQYPKDKQLAVQIVMEKLVPDIPVEFAVPAVGVEGVERNRGVLVFRLSDEYQIQVKPDENVVRVDANQIPATLRSLLKSAASEVYKYNRSPYQVAVAIDRAPLVEARLNADLSLMATIEEESIKCDASVRYEIVRGQVDTLRIQLPPDVWVNTVAVPDLKNYDVKKTSDTQEVVIELQSKAKGNVAVAVNYERLLKDSEVEAVVPVPTLPGVERMRHTYAVAAPPNIEVVLVEPSAKGVLSVDSLPADLKSRATMPVLLAFQFAREPEPVRLKVLKHTYVAVQDSVVDTANATTIHTRDGIDVTMLSLNVHNTRRQFLKVTLEEDCRIWNTFVGGEVVSPARDAEGHILIPLRRSGPAGGGQVAFPVDIIYMQRGKAMKRSGRLGLRLPQIDVAINELAWSVYMPDDYRYFEPEGNIRPMTTRFQRINLEREESYRVDNLYQFSGDFNKDAQVRRDIRKEAEEAQKAKTPAAARQYRNRSLERQAQIENDLFQLGQQVIPQRFQQKAAPANAPGVRPGKPPVPTPPILPLRVNIPTEGKIYRFSKLYLPENAEGAFVDIPYSGSWVWPLVYPFL